MGDIGAFYAARWEGYKWSRGRKRSARIARRSLGQSSQESTRTGALMAHPKTRQDDPQSPPRLSETQRSWVGIGIVVGVFAVLFGAAEWADDIIAWWGFEQGWLNYAP